MGDFVGHNVKGANQVVLKEIMEFAEYLGMDPVEDGDLLWIAEQARNAPLPAPWSEHQDEAGNTYYYNSATDDSVWEHPLDQYYRDLYRKHKDEKDEQKRREAAFSKENEMAAEREAERKAAKQARAEKRLKKKTRAATNIQSIWRGRKGRRRFNAEIERHANVTFWAASKLQAVFRAKKARRRAEEEKLERYATKIQSRFRGRRLRRMVIQNVSELVAAMTVQRMWRGKLIRREFLRKRGEIQKQLDWENENYQATRIQTIWRFKMKQRANQREREREEQEAREAEEAADKEWADVREAEKDLEAAIASGDEAAIAQAKLDLQRETEEAEAAQADAQRERREADEAAQLLRSEALKFKMGQSMAANMHERKTDALAQESKDALMQMMAHDVGQAAEAAGRRSNAKQTKLEMARRAEMEQVQEAKSAKQLAKEAKKARKREARQQLMVRMQTAAAVMVQRAFRRRMFRKRMRLLSRRTHVAAAKIQLAWRWHLSLMKKREKQFIVKRLTILMDSLSHSLAQREQEVATRDGAIYIQKMWRGYMARELLSVLKAEHDAAQRIQRAVRGWLLRMWLKRSRAAIRIQASFRGFRIRVRIARAKARDKARREREREVRERRRRREEKRKYEIQLQKEQERERRAELEKAALAEKARKAKELERQKETSATRIQSVFRGFLTRNIVFPLLLEQRRLNAEADRIRADQREHAATTIQANYRGARARKQLRRELAAIKIQAVWRGWLCRAGPYLQEFSAREIQRYFRGHYTRNYLAAYLETQALSDAATRIQQNFRAFAVRRRVSRWDMVANTVQSAFRGYIAREYVRKKRVDVYATKLQSVFRGWKGRRNAYSRQTGKEHDAARTVQAMWRGRACRQAILRDMYHWCAAFQIQRAFRRKLRRKDRAATNIQGLWRSKQARSEMGRRRNRKDQIIHLRKKRRAASATIQRWFRSRYIVRLPMHKAAAMIQAGWRGILGRRIAARERFLFEQKYGNYKEFMLDMYAQIDDKKPSGLASPGDGKKGEKKRGRKSGKRDRPTRKQLLEEQANPFSIDPSSLESDMGVKMIWLKFDAETVNNMAQYFYRRNKPLAALQYLEKALWQDQRLKQRDFVAKTCLHFSNVLSKLGRHEEALKLSEQSLILFQAEQQFQKQQREANSDPNSAAELAGPGSVKGRKAKHGSRTDGTGGHAHGSGSATEAGEDDVVDTIEAAIAIAFHNIAVQQMCCGLLEDAGKSSASALSVGKKCIEEWHPWVRQMETTHLAAVKLTGGFPAMADISDVILPPAELDHRGPLPRDAEVHGAGQLKQPGVNGAGRRARRGGDSGRGRGRGRGRAGRGRLPRLPPDRRAGGLVAAYGGGGPTRQRRASDGQPLRGRGQARVRKNRHSSARRGNLPYIDSQSVDPESLREMRGPPRYTRSPREHRQYSDDEDDYSGRHEDYDSSGDEPPRSGGARRAWQSGELEDRLSDRNDDDQWHGPPDDNYEHHNGSTRIVDWPVDDEEEMRAPLSGRSSAPSQRSSDKPPRAGYGKPGTPDSRGSSRASRRSADMFDGDTDWNLR